MRTSIVIFFALISVLASPILKNSHAQQLQSTIWELRDWEPGSAQSPIYSSQATAYMALANSSDNLAPETPLGSQATDFDAASAIQDSMISVKDAQFSGQRSQTNSQIDTPRAFGQSPGLTTSIEDPVVNLGETRLLREQAKKPGDALFSTSPLTPLRERFIAREKRLYEATDFKYGANLNTLFQGLTDNIDGTDGYGMSSFLQMNGTWDGFRKGERNQGELTFGVEGRWNWGTTEPTTLGNVGLGSLTFTSNPFTRYAPTFLVRNLFWRQGSREAGWMYRVGRVTPDQFLSTSQHVTPLAHNLPIASTGAFAMGLPDSGIGMFGGFFLNDRVNIAGVVTDANADRTKFGQIQEGDLFTAIELQAKILPFTKNAGYSKLTFWNNDGTKFGDAINGSTGQDGWGFFIKGEQELSRDGRIIGLLRYGKSYRDSALFEQLAAGHFLVYDPFNAGRYKRRGFNADVLGMVYGWVQPTGVDRDESNLEVFYRFALFPEMQATVSYQAIINPALDPTNNYGSAISFRLRSTW